VAIAFLKKMNIYIPYVFARELAKLFGSCLRVEAPLAVLSAKQASVFVL